VFGIGNNGGLGGASTGVSALTAVMVSPVLARSVETTAVATLAPASAEDTVTRSWSMIWIRLTWAVPASLISVMLNVSTFFSTARRAFRLTPSMPGTAM